MPGLPLALTGGTGFVGRHLLPQLLRRGCEVRALARDRARVPLTDPRLHWVEGDLFDAPALAELVRGAQAVVHLVGIIVERPRQGQTFPRIHVEATGQLLAAAQAAGARRWLHMSALGTRPGAHSEYHRTKWQAEELVRARGLAWTIFRPSLIHGPDGEFVQMVRGFWCRRFPPVVPYFGAGLLGRGGAGRLQPVWVEDVARCFAEALDRPGTAGQTYEVGGPEVYTWPEVYRMCRRHLAGARRKPIVAIPAWKAKLLAHLPGVPFNRDQVIMSQEDSTCDLGPLRRDLGFEPAAFEPTFAAYASAIR